MSNNIKRVINHKNNIIVGLLVVCTILVILLGICIYLLSGNSTNGMEDAIEIKTPYCELYYPDKWEDQVRIEKYDDAEAYVIDFYGTVGAHDEQKLFTLVFNGDEGVAIGYINQKNGERISFGIESYETESFDGLTEEERLDLCSMQEDVNFILENLMALEKFEIKG